VRLFTDGWVPGMPEHDDEELVMAVELEASRRDPYRQMSRLLHVVGIREGNQMSQRPQRTVTNRL
jgi:hypothetical protein